MADAELPGVKTSVASVHTGSLEKSQARASIDVENGIPRLLDESKSQSPPLADEDNTTSNAPQLSALQIFWFFFATFGIFAWGGPVAQIALIKDRLVLRDKWITMARFNRVFAVYQILPGPEAAELCMFFGCLAGGRLGGLAAGLGFILPGFVLMLIASYLYALVGFTNAYVNASFQSLQPIVAAMVPNSTNVMISYPEIMPT